MNLSAKEQSGGPTAPTPSAAGPRRARTPRCRAALAVVALLGTGVLTAACAARPHVNVVGGLNRPLAFVSCMRTHGEPHVPDPVVTGNSAHITIKVGSGVDPRSPQFTHAYQACKHLT